MRSWSCPKPALVALLALACENPQEPASAAGDGSCVLDGVIHANGTIWSCAAGTCRCDAGQVVTTPAGSGGDGSGGAPAVGGEGPDGDGGEEVAGGGVDGGGSGAVTTDGGASATNGGAVTTEGGAAGEGGGPEGGASAPGGDASGAGADTAGANPGGGGEGGADAGGAAGSAGAQGGADPGGAMTSSAGDGGAGGEAGHSGAAPTCTPSDPPDERCDGIDNDCDGELDEAFPESGVACDTGALGVCAAGTTACSEGALACVADLEADDEACNGLDDDCDDEVDEAFPEAGAACDTGLLGVCATGTTTCVEGALACAQSTEGSAEACNGLDDDCNGFADADAAGVAGETDVDRDGYLSCADCDDGDPDNYASCDTCVDGDGDGYFVACDGYTDHPGPDCDDAEALVPLCTRNVILMVGDGMGFEQVRATGMYWHGAAGTLYLETAPVAGAVITHSLSYPTPTDSAAAGSAMATGRKYLNEAVSYADDQDVTTVLELHQAAGKSAGLVTTHTPFVDATPAAFGAHVADRDSQALIAADLRDGSRPNVLIGAADADVSQAAFEGAGYRWVTTRAELDGVPADATHVAGVFGNTSPTLTQRALFAVERLSQDPEGFFLLVEHEGIDEAGHDQAMANLVATVAEFDAAVEAVVAWASARGDTLVVVLADHETGGLTVTEPTPAVGELPAATWSSTEHTNADAPIFVFGGTLPGPLIDNTEVFALLGG